MVTMNFLQLLNPELRETIHELPINECLNLFIQLDGCPVHYAKHCPIFL